MSTSRLVFATANPDKVAEIREILANLPGVELVARPPQAPDVIEDGATLEDNARLKARALRDFTGLAAVADDTGLEVDALDGAPGVASARYAGEEATYAENVAKLLDQLGRLPDGGGDRRACFRTVALVAFSNGTELIGEGSVTGHIARSPRGEGGFGYDPVFVADESGGKTFAEMTPDEKHALSHRGNAFRALATALRDRSAGTP